MDINVRVQQDSDVRGYGRAESVEIEIGKDKNKSERRLPEEPARKQVFRTKPSSSKKEHRWAASASRWGEVPVGGESGDSGAFEQKQPKELRNEKRVYQEQDAHKKN